jgi:hypothetical protein
LESLPRLASRAVPLRRFERLLARSIRHRTVHAEQESIDLVSPDIPHGESMSADRCRQLAADCLRLAQATEEPSEKALLLEMAERWRQLAEQFEARQQSGDRGTEKNSDSD